MSILIFDLILKTYLSFGTLILIFFKTKYIWYCLDWRIHDINIKFILLILSCENIVDYLTSQPTDCKIPLSGGPIFWFLQSLVANITKELDHEGLHDEWTEKRNVCWSVNFTKGSGVLLHSQCLWKGWNQLMDINLSQRK